MLRHSFRYFVRRRRTGQPLRMGLVVASVVLAATPAWAGTSERTFEAVLNLVWSRLKTRLLPGVGADDPQWVYALVIGATALSLVWMLGSKKLRHLIGRIGGFALFGIVLDSAWGIWAILRGALGNYLIAALVLALFSSTVRGLLWGALRWSTIGMVQFFWAKSRQVAALKEPPIGWTLVSALVLSGLINGASWSNPRTMYLPSILSSLLGAGVLAWGLTHMLWVCHAVDRNGKKPCERRRNWDWNQDRPRCRHCGAWNPRVDWPCGRDGCKAVNAFRDEKCGGCGKPNPHIDAQGRPVHPDRSAPRPPETPAPPARQAEPEPTPPAPTPSGAEGSSGAPAPERGLRCAACGAQEVASATHCGACGRALRPPPRGAAPRSSRTFDDMGDL